MKQLWGLGIGDWGLGIGPNPQSTIPNPQSPNTDYYFYLLNSFNFTKVSSLVYYSFLFK